MKLSSHSRSSDADALASSTGPLSDDELARYARQIRLPSLGVEGQLKLQGAERADRWRGRTGIARGDVSRRRRRRPHRHRRRGSRRSVESSSAAPPSQRRRRIAQGGLGAHHDREINPHVRVDAIGERVSAENALDLVTAYDVVIDGTDNFPTRYLLNDACVMTGRPLVYGSVDRFEGQVSVFATEHGPCYRCLFPRPPEPGTVQNCADAGVLGVLPGLIGTLQATEALKMILGLGDPLIGRLLLVDTLSMRFRTIGVDRDPTCPACGTREIQELIDYEAFCAGEPIRSQPMRPQPGAPGIIAPAELSAALNQGESIVVIDVREPYEWQIGRIPTARLIPLATLLAEPPDLDRTASIVVYCHHGSRSDAAARALAGAGFTDVRNLVGGIDRWSREVDPLVRRY